MLLEITLCRTVFISRTFYGLRQAAFDFGLNLGFGEL